MKQYRYWAKDSTNQQVTGVFDADSAGEVVRTLHFHNLRDIRVQIHSWRHVVDRIPVVGSIVRTLLGKPSRTLVAGIKNQPPAPIIPPPPMPVIKLRDLNTYILNPPPGLPKLNKVDQTLTDAGIGYGLGTVRDQVDRVLSTFVPDDLNDTERESWFFHRARGADDGHDREEGMRRAQASFRMMPHSAKIRLQLVRQHEYTGQTDEMFKLLDEMTPRPKEMGYCLTAAHFAYLWDDYDRALKYLNPLIDIYQPVNQTVSPQDIPNIAAPLWSAAAIGVAMGQLTPVRQVFERVAKRFGELPDTSAQMYLEGRSQNDFSNLIQFAEETITFSEGMLPLQAAILRSQTMEDPVEASQLIAKVRIPSWRHDLESVRWIVMSDLARQIGNEDQEQGLTNHVLQRMPMLLAPEVVGFFNLVEPMDRYKEAYRSTRQK